MATTRTPGALIRSIAAGCLVLLTGFVLPTESAGAAGVAPLTVGLNSDGQLATGNTTARTAPGPTTGLADSVAIASGREHAYSLTDTGRIRAWGDNSRGAIGDNSTVDRPTPVLLGLTDVVQVEAGHYHGVALRSDGTVWTWGYNGLGQLGLGNTATRRVPTQVGGLTGITQVAAGRDMTYAVGAGGIVWAWGSNAGGEVGDGTTVRRLAPVQVTGLANVVELAGGRNHALARLSDGSLWAWGANDFGQLGTGTTVRSLVPIRVITSGVRHVDSGAEHSLAVMIDGTVRAWGRGQRGQLGLGTTSTRTSPTVVSGLPSIVEVGDGRDQSFALTVGGDVWAWGMNDLVQLGDGTTTNRLVPTRITALSGIVAAQGGRGMSVFLPALGVPPDPDTVPPSAPGQPSGASTVAGQANLTWAAATDDRATSLAYAVLRDGGATPIATVTAGVTGTVNFIDTGLEPGSVHTWSVRAFDGVNTGPTSPVSEPITIAEAQGGEVLLQTDFGTGLVGWTGATNIAVDSSVGSPGDAPPSLRVQISNAAGTARRALASTTTAACTEVDLRIAALSGTTNYSALKLRSSNGASFARVWVLPSRQLAVRADITGTQFNAGASITLGTWYRIGLCSTIGAQGSLSLVVDGVTVGSWTANTGTSPFAAVQIGDNDPRTATVNWDRLVVVES